MYLFVLLLAHLRKDSRYHLKFCNSLPSQALRTHAKISSRSFMFVDIYPAKLSEKKMIPTSSSKLGGSDWGWSGDLKAQEVNDSTMTSTCSGDEYLHYPAFLFAMNEMTRFFPLSGAICQFSPEVSEMAGAMLSTRLVQGLNAAIVAGQVAASLLVGGWNMLPPSDDLIGRQTDQWSFNHWQLGDHEAPACRSLWILWMNVKLAGSSTYCTWSSILVII